MATILRSNTLYNNNAPDAYYLTDISFTHNNLTDISFTHNENFVPSVQSTMNSDTPYLTIEEEPDKHLRFRYKSEKGRHGGLKPVVKVNNYNEDPVNIYIKASLYAEGEDKLHVFDLETKKVAGCVKENGAIWLQVSEDYTAKFPALSIEAKKREEILDILKERKKLELKKNKIRGISESEIEEKVKEELKNFKVDIAKLCFEAYYKKSEVICEKVFSTTIHNKAKKAIGNELKITRLSSCVGKTTGGDEIILLCEKVDKKDIDIYFFEEDHGEIGWEVKAEFNPNDIHHQVAIPFKVPPYRENVEREVWIQLRKSDGSHGQPRPFRYIPVDEIKGSKKRKINDSEDAIRTLDTSNDQLNGESSLSYGIEDLIHKMNMDDISFIPNYGNVATSEILDFNIFSDKFPEDISPNSNNELHLAEPELLFNEMLECDAAFGNLTLTEAKPAVKNILQTRHIQELQEGITSILMCRGTTSFLKFLPTLLDLKDEKSNTLLHLALIEKSNNLSFLLNLLRIVPTQLINEENNLKMTPIHLAISQGLWKVVRGLLCRGANPNLKDKDGNNGVHYAVKHNSISCLNEILAFSLKKKQEENFDLNIDTLNYEGLAPLHLSVLHNYHECAEVLVKAKANINVTDGKSGKTPLHMAYEQSSKCLGLLLSQPNADREATDFKGCVPVPCTEGVTNTKPTECCINLSTDSSSSSNDESVEDVKPSWSLNERTEKKLCEMLDSSGTGRCLGIYVMEEEKLDLIYDMDSTTSSKIFVKELKRIHSENYEEKLREILLSDRNFLEVVKELNIQ